MTDSNSQLSIALVGYGAMGREIEALTGKFNSVVSARYDLEPPITPDAPDDFDVAIEFTHPSAVIQNIEVLCRIGKPFVVGTTGWLNDLEHVKQMVLDHNARMVYASNFSIGVNLFFKIIREASRMFNLAEMYDVAVNEIHHIRKADSPSGTALTTAGIILEELERKKNLLTETAHGRIDPEALHVTSQRLGAVAGTHSVSFDCDADTIEIVHRAKNRSGFAAGALTAARWITNQPPGLYRFEDSF